MKNLLKKIWQGDINLTWADVGYQKNIRITVGTEEDNSACLAALKEALA